VSRPTLGLAFVIPLGLRTPVGRKARGRFQKN
jgi:hypothetical protein